MSRFDIPSNDDESKSEKYTIFYVDRDYMDSVFEISSLKDLPQEVYDFFMNHDSEIIYLLRNGKLQSIISIGDLERYFLGNDKKLKVNSKFSLLTRTDYKEAEKFFRSSKTVNEIPVVTKSGGLQGIIKKEKSWMLRNDQRNSLQNAKYGKDEWYRRELKRFIDHTKAKVFIYGIDIDKVEEALRDDFKIFC